MAKQSVDKVMKLRSDVPSCVPAGKCKKKGAVRLSGRLSGSCCFHSIGH